MFQGSLKSVSRKFYECFKEDSSVIQGSFREISSFKGVSTKIEGNSSSFMGFHRYLKEVQQVSGMLQWCFKGV